MNNKNRFGKLKEAYDSGRREYPKEVIDHISSFASKEIKVLDLGCGTGIATRQLSKKGVNIVGCDSDSEMISVAERYEESKVRYFNSPAEDMPFENNEFDIITSFGAFHWFKDRKSIKEIKRVLKNKGLFIVINKNDSGRFRKEYRNIIQNIVGILPSSVKRGYSPVKILEENNFSEVKKKIFTTEESFTIEEALTLIKSTGTWNHVPENLSEKVEQTLKERFSKIALKGVIKRPLEIVVVKGLNS